MKVTLFRSMFSLLTAASMSLMLCGCDPQGSGLKQRISDLEAQRDAREKQIVDLQARLKEFQSAKPASAAPELPPTEHEDQAAAAAAANEFLLRLKEKAKTEKLAMHPKVIFVGFSLKQADGKSAGVSVPFFGTVDGRWESGWTEARVMAELKPGSVDKPSDPDNGAVRKGEVPNSGNANNSSQPHYGELAKRDGINPGSAIKSTPQFQPQPAPPLTPGMHINPDGSRDYVTPDGQGHRMSKTNEGAWFYLGVGNRPIFPAAELHPK